MALSRNQRLYKPYKIEYDRVFRMDVFLVKVQKGENKAAVFVPKKVIPEAHRRNRIKRQCVEALRKAFRLSTIGTVFVKVERAPIGDVSRSMELCIQKVREDSV